MNVVIYARYSSHSQTEQSIEGQLQTCYEFAKNNGHIVIGEYIDRAQSGTTENPSRERWNRQRIFRLFCWLRVGQYPDGHVAARLDWHPWRYMEFPADFKPDRWEVGEAMYESFVSFPGKKFRRAPDGQILLQSDACNNGGAADCYFEAYNLLKKAGIDKAEYLEAAYRICDFALKNQRESGAFYKSWDEQGNVLAKDGTIGCFLVLPLITAYQMGKDRKYLDGAKKAFDFYYGSLEWDGFTTAGALDTYCIDKESASPLLRDALALYDVTGEGRYLKAAEKIAWYLCTWMMHFTIHYPKDSLIGKMGYDTFGSTSVSTAHQALDQYALRDVLSFIRLYELTGFEQ